VPLEDRWFFDSLNYCAETTSRAIDTYRFHEAADTLYHFFWHEFCDWYVELKKLRIQEQPESQANLRNLLKAFEISLRLLHPVMPFLTEELWQRQVRKTDSRPASVALANYPIYESAATDHLAVREMAVLQEIVAAARNLRADLQITDPKQVLNGTLYSTNDALRIARAELHAIERLANVKLELRDGHAPQAERASARSPPAFDLVLEVPHAQLDAQRKRLEKDIQQLEKVIASSQRQLSDETFISKAPAKVVDGIRQKLADYEAQLAKRRGAMEELVRQ
jgi:valyl-tRNA synthetase